MDKRADKVAEIVRLARIAFALEGDRRTAERLARVAAEREADRLDAAGVFS
jgi:hypothetical protein